MSEKGKEKLAFVAIYIFQANKLLKNKYVSLGTFYFLLITEETLEIILRLNIYIQLVIMFIKMFIINWGNKTLESAI